MMRTLAIAVLASILVTALCFGVAADIPRLINYQGILTDSGGLPLDGPHNLTFKIYPDTTQGAAALWTEVHTGVPVNGGLFNVILGGTTALSDDLFAGAERWLGVTVDADAEMFPRFRITSTPWALHAAVADSAIHGGSGLGGSGTTGYVAKFASAGVLGNSAITEIGGKVGVGTASPWVTLQVGDAGGSEKKSVAVFGQVDRNYTGNTPDTPHFMTYGGADTRFGVGHSWGALSLVAFDMDTYGAGNVKVFTGNKREGSPSAERLRVTANGRVGIGTTSPAQLLDVAGTAQMTGLKMPTGAGAGLVLTSDAAGVGTWQAPGAVPDGDWTISGSDLYSAVSGNVGIGTASPSQKLEVSGNLLVDGDITTAAKTRYYVVPACTFNPEQSTYSYTRFGLALWTSTGGETHWSAPVNLPHGAIMTDFAVWFLDASDVSNISAGLLRCPHGSESSEHLVAVTSSGSSGEGQMLDDPNINNPSVDNGNYHYYVEVSMGGGDQFLRLRSVRITYTVTEPLP